MTSNPVRAAIVGASSLLGKELANELNATDTHVWNLTLLDVATEDGAQAGGKVTSAGDEALLIQNLAPGAFSGMDVVFFAADPGVAARHAMEAVEAGAIVVDLTGEFENKTVPVGAPLIAGSPKLAGKLAVAAHPAAILLGMVSEQLAGNFTDAALSATVMEPASQAGDAGVDEVHRQTVALLSFQQVPKDVYGQQVAFSLSASSPDDATVRIEHVAERVKKQLALLSPATRIEAQFVQAPVFHGYSASIFVQTTRQVEMDDVEETFSKGPFEVLRGDEESSTIAAVERGAILVRISQPVQAGFWLWVACDNLKLSAQNAVACGISLLGS